MVSATPQSRSMSEAHDSILAIENIWASDLKVTDVSIDIYAHIRHFEF